MLHLRPALESDARSMGLIGTRAFASTISTLLFPPSLRVPGVDHVEEETTWRTARTLRRIRAGIVSHVVVDVDDHGVETVVGFAQWERPQPATEEKVNDGAHQPAENLAARGLDVDGIARLEDMIGEESKRILGERGYKDMWYLMVLAVDSNQQRRGIGAKLLSWGLEQAAQEGKKVFLYATPDGRPLYEKYGFKVVKDVDIGIQHYAMLWTAPEVESS